MVVGSRIDIRPVDLDDLERMSRSEGGEAYLSVARGESFRIAVGVSLPLPAPRYGIEVLLRPFAPGSPVDAKDMERTAGLARELRALGYYQRFQEGGWISSEKCVQREDVERELRSLVAVLEAFDIGRSP